ncbi:hypothetical protein BOX15_Mlig012325g4 [Macrostomum lignano]|uniref:Uncharacterized protein n=1 Tax=Macrostomum lignano TaxID=282301 RepID=A0A267DDV5_9PLAT|nr:hypothetical protein BOX15_Mlig012325g4 [Macrostomum lignano]
MESESSCESSSGSGFSPTSVDRRVFGRSLEWMKLTAGQQKGWAARRSLRHWNPWTNETAESSKQPRPDNPQSISSGTMDAVAVTTKAAGCLHELLSRQERQQAAELERRRSDSNTNNKNPFGQSKAGGLRDIQRHSAEGKQTTIITQFKAAEKNKDGMVDINIIMDSESNVSNARESSDDGGTTSTSKEGAEGSGAGVSSTDNEDIADDGGGGGGGGGSSTEDDEADQQETPSTSAGEDAAGGEGGDEGGEGDGEGDAEDGEPAEDLPAPGEEKKADKTDKKKLNMGHLDKEGIVIGCMNVFADVSRKEYIVLLTDQVVEAFLVDPGQFRSIAKRTGCEIEVTRRILNRRIGMYRWVKYLVVTLRGPHLVAIDQCDRLMVKMFPPYKIRKPYPEAAQVALFVKESYPDNSDLYFNYQRTGPTCSKVGDLRMQSPFGKNPARPIETTQWKQSNPRLLQGILEPRNLPMAISVEHVYPEWGSEKCSFMDESCKWEQAGDLALEIEKKNNLERSTRVKQRKLGAEPLFAGGD